MENYCSRYEIIQRTIKGEKEEREREREREKERERERKRGITYVEML